MSVCCVADSMPLVVSNVTISSIDSTPSPLRSMALKRSRNDFRLAVSAALASPDRGTTPTIDIEKRGERGEGDGTVV